MQLTSAQWDRLAAKHISHAYRCLQIGEECSNEEDARADIIERIYIA